jgi:hypothetical protein
VGDLDKASGSRLTDGDGKGVPVDKEPEPCVPNEKCDWDPEEDPPAWWREAIDEVSWKEVRENGTVLWFEKTVDCPRCHDDGGVRKEVPAEAWADVAAKLRTLTEPLERDRLLDENRVFVTCTCSGTHGNRPAEIKQGCGYGGYVAGPVSSP